MPEKTNGYCRDIKSIWFATLAAIAMGYFIFFIYTYVTTQIIEKLDNTMKVLIALIDRVRMLDNDIIRLRSKLNTVLELKENEKKKTTDI